MRIYYNNGIGFRDSLEPHNIQEGEVYFDHIPTDFELEEAFPLYIQSKLEYENYKIEAQRKLAYQQEADPLFFMSQRGECDVSEWHNKVTEIKDRYPYLITLTSSVVTIESPETVYES